MLIEKLNFADIWFQYYFHFWVLNFFLQKMAGGRIDIGLTNPKNG